MSRKEPNGGVTTVSGKRVATPEYTSWQLMKDRCMNNKNKRWDRYGGRGITVCSRWMRFSEFIADMGLKPTNKHTLERVDNDSGYNPTNCVWATRLTQSRNRDYCVDYTYVGITAKSWEWAELLGVTMSAFHHYVYRHKSGEYSSEFLNLKFEKLMSNNNG